ncbi:hypothetical protein ElyMa_006004600 [Elysia marginata]|uniref:Uncharacterized protein n=1 Tax=Elysia marginata TaxID=1093978 RepID=A0AAV4GH07_9GAST|nr:hypothetical protein ElyMa_006004600 [Elysia marginata]
MLQEWNRDPFFRTQRIDGQETSPLKPRYKYNRQLISLEPALYAVWPSSPDIPFEPFHGTVLFEAHAVVFVVEITPNLELDFSESVRRLVMQNFSWQNDLKKKGVMIVKNAERFRAARDAGNISVSFLDWMRKQTGVTGLLFKKLQERCLLFDTYGNVDVVTKQRRELIDTIEVRILGGGYYTDIRFKESERKCLEIKEQLSDLNKKTSRKTSLLLMSSLILILAMLVQPFFWSNSTNHSKETTAQDIKSQEFRRDMDVKFEQMTRRMQEMEKEITKILGQMKKETLEKENKVDCVNLTKITQDVMELLSERKEQLPNETAELNDNGERESVVWAMIKSLLVSETLTLMLLLLVPYRVPRPWQRLVDTVLKELRLVQFMLLLLLSGVYAVETFLIWI